MRNTSGNHPKRPNCTCIVCALTNKLLPRNLSYDTPLFFTINCKDHPRLRSVAHQKSSAMESLYLYKLFFARKNTSKKTVQDADINLNGIELKEHTDILIRKVETNSYRSTFTETALTANFLQSEKDTEFRQRLISGGSSTDTASTISPESSPFAGKKKRTSSGIPRPIWACKRGSSTETASMSSDSSSEHSPLLEKKSVMSSRIPTPENQELSVKKDKSTPRKIKNAFGNLKTRLVASRQNKYQAMGAEDLDQVGDSGFEDARDTAARMSSRKSAVKSSGKSRGEKVVKKHCCLGNM